MSTLLKSIRKKAQLLQKAKIKKNPNFKLKEAYEILAKSAQFSSWRDWKKVLDDQSAFTLPVSSMWHTWYSSYDEALSHLKLKDEHFLIPFQKQFFICDEHYIGFLGIEINDPHLKKVGNDWTKPADLEAWEQLKKKMKKN